MLQHPMGRRKEEAGDHLSQVEDLIKGESWTRYLDIRFCRPSCTDRYWRKHCVFQANIPQALDEHTVTRIHDVLEGWSVGLRLTAQASKSRIEKNKMTHFIVLLCLETGPFLRKPCGVQF
jgi:hypothetical protein